VYILLYTDVPGLRFLRHPESALALPGSEVTFDCALNVSADRVEWRHRGHPLKTGSSDGGGRLVVRLSNEPTEYNEQSGIYQVREIYRVTCTHKLAELLMIMKQHTTLAFFHTPIMIMNNLFHSLFLRQHIYIENSFYGDYSCGLFINNIRLQEKKNVIIFFFWEVI
jgi:hypothetical protein